MINPELRQQRAHSYESSRPDVQSLVPIDARNILELGCSSGPWVRRSSHARPARVHGVELSSDYSADARSRLDHVDQESVEAFLSRGRPSDAPY